MSWITQHTGKIWLTAGAIVGLALTAAFTVLGYTLPEFDAARSFFWLSAVAITMATVISLAEVSWPFWLRAVAAGFIGAITLILLVEGLRLVKRRELAFHESLLAASKPVAKKPIPIKPHAIFVSKGLFRQRGKPLPIANNKSGIYEHLVKIESSKPWAWFLQMEFKNESDSPIVGDVSAQVAFRDEQSGNWLPHRAVPSRWGNTPEPLPSGASVPIQFGPLQPQPIALVMYYPNDGEAYTFTNFSYLDTYTDGKAPALGVFPLGSYLAHVQLFGGGWKCAWDVKFEVRKEEPLRIITALKDIQRVGYFVNDDGSVTDAPDACLF